MRKILLLFLSLLLVLPASALGQSNPGNSAGDQYEENIPDPDGGNDSGDQTGGGQNAPGGGSGLPPGVAEDLAEQGSDGAAAAALAEQTDPGGESDAGGDEQGEGKDADRGEAASASAGATDGGDEGGSGLGNVVQTATGTEGDSSGTGILLPIVIAAAVLGAIVILISRRRGSRAPDPA